MAHLLTLGAKAPGLCLEHLLYESQARQANLVVPEYLGSMPYMALQKELRTEASCYNSLACLAVLYPQLTLWQVNPSERLRGWYNHLVASSSSNWKPGLLHS